MEVAAHKITILPRGDPTFPVDPYTAWVTNDLTRHVLYCMDLFFCSYPLPTDWPACYVIWPLVWRDRSRLLAVAAKNIKMFNSRYGNIYLIIITIIIIIIIKSNSKILLAII